MAEYPKNGPDKKWQAVYMGEVCSDRLQGAPITDPRRARGLAASASQTGIQMRAERAIGGSNLSGFQASHEYDSSPRAIALIARG